MPEGRLAKARQGYYPGDFHRRNRDGIRRGSCWVPALIPGGTHITDGPWQAARDAGAKTLLWNDRLWSVQPPVNPIVPNEIERGWGWGV